MPYETSAQQTSKWHDIFKNDFQIEIDSQRLLKEYNNVKLAKQLDVVELS